MPTYQFLNIYFILKEANDKNESNSFNWFLISTTVKSHLWYYTECKFIKYREEN